MTQNLQKFIDEVFTQAGLTQLPQDSAIQYKQRFQELLEERMGLMALRELDDEAVEKMVQLLNQEKDQETLLTFLREHIKDFDQKMQATVQEVSQDFLRGSKPETKKSAGAVA